MNIRVLHRKLAPFIFIPLIVSATTGLVYRLGKKWFGMDGQTGNKVMDIHAGEWLGDIGSVIYVVLVGSALIFLLINGASLLAKSRSRQPVRLWHRMLGVALLLPLLATAVTGILFKLGNAWWGFSEGTLDLLMHIHEGAWLGRDLKAFYVLIMGLGLLGMGVLGLTLRWPRKTRKAAGNPS